MKRPRSEGPALRARYRVVRFDIRPFGESTVPNQPYKTTDDLLALMDALKIDRARPATVIGVEGRAWASGDRIQPHQGAGT